MGKGKKGKFNRREGKRQTDEKWEGNCLFELNVQEIRFPFLLLKNGGGEIRSLPLTFSPLSPRVGLSVSYLFLWQFSVEWS